MKFSINSQKEKKNSHGHLQKKDTVFTLFSLNKFLFYLNFPQLFIVSLAIKTPTTDLHQLVSHCLKKSRKKKRGGKRDTFHKIRLFCST